MSRIAIIAEAGVNHDGKIDQALRLCDAARDAGADAVKFQTFKTEMNISRWAPTPRYQVRNGVRESQFDLIKRLEFGRADFTRLKRHCDSLRIEFLSTPDDDASLRLLRSLGVSRLKVASGEVTNLPFLRRVGESRLPVILSTGMSYLSEVETALRALTDAGAPSVVLLHCTTQYPCPMREVNLRAMLTLRDAFKTNVGYSDHTLGFEVAVAATAMGASVIEKHFTLDPSLPGPDHKASLGPDEFRQLVEAVRNVERAMGDGIKRPTASEERSKVGIRRTVVAARNLAVGEALRWGALLFKRAPEGIPVEDAPSLLGRKLRRSIRKDRPVRWDDLR
jgi:N-acetylneuraminate synthase/N,N'-diacetyllegionaminate synthase